MIPLGRIVGVGGPYAGDDAVGLAVIAHLRKRDVPDGLLLDEAPGATALLPFLEQDLPLVVVDAVLGIPAGESVVLAPQAMLDGPRTASSHGFGVEEAIALARVLGSPGAGRVQLVGIGIEAPRRFEQGLSPEVARGVPQAAALALSLLRRSP